MSKTSIAIFSALLFLLSLGIAVQYSTVEHVTVVPHNAERITTKENSYFFVYTDIEQFRNTDTLLFLKFNSADVQSSILQNKGNHMKCKVNGFRVPFMSMYRNIIQCYPINPSYLNQ